MTPERIAEATAEERAEIMAEIEARHAPKFHGSHPCPSGGCCSCGAEGGCDTGVVLTALAAQTARAEAAERRGGKFENLAKRMGELNGALLAERDALARETERLRTATGSLVDKIEAYQAYVDHIIVGWRPSSGQEKRRALELWKAVEESTDALAAAAGAGQEGGAV